MRELVAQVFEQRAAELKSKEKAKYRGQETTLHTTA
jgi:hypothetical protein